MAETMEQTEPHLEKAIGPFSATMLGVGAMIGAGIFVLSGIAAGHAGPALVLAFGLNGIVALAIGACYAELGSAMPRAGGSFYWVKQAMGHRSGFAVGWISLYANAVASALYALGFGAFVVALLAKLGLEGITYLETISAVGLTVAVTFLQYRGIRDLRVAENIVTVGKVVLLLVLIGGGFAVLYSRPEPMEAFTPFAPNGFKGVVLAMAVIFVAFEGFEVITRTGEELRNPGRNIPLAIFSSIAIAVLLYLLIAFVLIAVVKGPDGSESWRFLGQLGEMGMAASAVQLLPYGDVIFYIAGIASTAGAMIAATYSAIRVTFAMGRAGDLNASLANLHSRHHSPFLAALLCGGLVLFMVISLPIVEVAGAASQMFALLFALVCIACWRLRRNRPEMERPFKAPLLPLCVFIGVCTGIGVIIMLINISPLAWFLSVAWLVMGWIIYRYKHS